MEEESGGIRDGPDMWRRNWREISFFLYTPFKTICARSQHIAECNLELIILLPWQLKYVKAYVCRLRLFWGKEGFLVSGQESLQEWNKEDIPGPMKSGEGRVFQAEKATMIGAWGGDLLLRSSLELDLWTHMQSLRVTKMGLTFSSSCFHGCGAVTPHLPQKQLLLYHTCSLALDMGQAVQCRHPTTLHQGRDFVPWASASLHRRLITWFWYPSSE